MPPLAVKWHQSLYPLLLLMAPLPEEGPSAGGGLSSLRATTHEQCWHLVSQRLRKRLKCMKLYLFAPAQNPRTAL